MDQRMIGHEMAIRAPGTKTCISRHAIISLDIDMHLTEHDKVSCVVSRDDDKHSSSSVPASIVGAQAVIVAKLPGRKSPPDDIIDAHTLALAKQYHVGRYYRFGRRAVVIWRDAPEGDISPWASVKRLIASRQLRVSRAGVVTLGIEVSPTKSND